MESGSLAETQTLLRQALEAELSRKLQQDIKADWSKAGRPDQQIPPGDWTTWLILAGRGWGKTRTASETVRQWVKRYPFVNLIGATADDARDILIEGESGILAICPSAERPTYLSHKRQLQWPNGARSLIFTADEPERLRGKQHCKLACLTGDTQVAMADGTSKRLDAVKVGEFVLTRNGPRRVLNHALTNRNSEVFLLKTMRGRVIVGTADHPVWVNGIGFVPLSSLTPGMGLCAIAALNGAAGFGTVIRTGITFQLLGSIEKYGKKVTARFRKAFTSTTRTATKPTIPSKILNCCRMESTARFMRKKNWGLIGSSVELGALRSEEQTVRKDWLFRDTAFSAATNTAVRQSTHLNTVLSDASAKPGRTLLRAKSAIASFVGRYIQLRGALSDIAPDAATPGHANPERMTWLLKKLPALLAVRSSNPNDQMQSFVSANAPHPSGDTVAITLRLSKRCDVYNITVENDPEFFANGVLVHNCDEVAAWRYPEALTQAMLGLRLGDKPQMIITTTPKPTKTIKELVASPSTYVTRGSTYDNQQNLAPSFFSQIISRYEGTRLGRQELNAEILSDNPGALWKRQWIDDLRVKQAPALKRIVVSIDPAATSNPDSDETGIVVVGLGSDSQGYVLADLSTRGTPEEWARIAVNAYHEWKADRIIGETNNGGEMVETVIRMVDRSVAFKAVHASRGKITRAEPVSAMYEQGRIHHVGAFPVLEDQQCDYDPRTAKYSPDRMDALVWGFTELMVEQAPGSGYLDLYSRLAKEAREANKNH